MSLVIAAGPQGKSRWHIVGPLLIASMGTLGYLRTFGLIDRASGSAFLVAAFENRRGCTHLLLIDQNENPLYDELCGQSLEVQRGAFNQTAGSSLVFPDFVCMNNGITAGVNNKDAAELLGSIDAVEEQLSRELLGPIDSLTLMVRGLIVPTSEGCRSYSVNEEGRINPRGRDFRTPYARVMSWYTGLWELGIPVVNTSNLRGSATFLVQLHNSLGKEESRIFKRLVTIRKEVQSYDLRERSLALFLMGIPGVGEEVALCLAREFEDMAELVQFMTNGGSLAGFVLASGRHVGPALDKRIAGFLGVKVAV